MRVSQHTLTEAVSLSGVGLHSGAPVSVELRPAPPSSGVRLVRDDVEGAEPVVARVENALDCRYATTIGAAGHWSVSTVEHMLAALSALGVDNVEVGVRGPEVPVLDGSAQPWVDAIERAGILEQSAPLRTLVIEHAIEFRMGGRVARVVPNDRFVVSAQIAFANARIGSQSLTVPFENGEFREEIAWARTFGFLAEVEAMQAMGLIKGGSLENAVVYAPDGAIVNASGSRGTDEPVRHKILDMLGDLALLGMPLVGRVEAFLPGHELTHGLVRTIREHPESWSIR
jgi:UDP-3-O-[3-hydroxymyristoyl] N-acetylglucosamine deacetylase